MRHLIVFETIELLFKQYSAGANQLFETKSDFCLSLSCLSFAYLNYTLHIHTHQHMLRNLSYLTLNHTKLLTSIILNSSFSRDYVTKFKNSDESFDDLIKDETFFRSKLTQFLYSPRGAIYQVNVLIQSQHQHLETVWSFSPHLKLLSPKVFGNENPWLWVRC